MGVICEEYSRNGVIGAARMRFSILTSFFSPAVGLSDFSMVKKFFPVELMPASVSGGMMGRAGVVVGGPTHEGGLAMVHTSHVSRSKGL